jgi:deoxyadenosine/deoxycytidine kinase
MFLAQQLVPSNVLTKAVDIFMIIILIILLITLCSIIELYVTKKIKRLFNKNKKIVISVEANIAAGKSTFLKILREHFKENEVAIVYEDVDSWQNIDGVNMLDRYYKDQLRWGFTFQMLAGLSRYKNLDLEVKNGKAKIIIVERSQYSDNACFTKMLHEDKILEDVEYNIYKRFHIWLRGLIHDIDGFVYLRAKPDTCNKRMTLRSRKEENKVIPDYLIKLHNKHEEWFERITKKKIYVDANVDFEHDIIEKDKIIKQVENFIVSVAQTL